MEKRRFSKPGGKSRIFVICLATAFVFWFFNALHAPSQRRVTLPVVYKHAPVAVRFVTPLPDRVTVVVEGRGFAFLTADLEAAFRPPEVDLAGLKPGRTLDTLRMQLAVRALLQPAAAGPYDPLRIVGTTPDTIGLAYSGNFSKMVPVVPDVAMQFRKQYMQDGPVVIRPDSIEITGTEAALRRITSIRTEPLTAADLHRTAAWRAVLDLKGKPVVTAEKTAWVLIPVSEYAEGTARVPVATRTVNNKPLVLLPAAVEVTYRAPVERFKEIGPADFAVDLLRVDLRPGAVNKSALVPVRVPGRVTVTALTPAWVDYYFLN